MKLVSSHFSISKSWPSAWIISSWVYLFFIISLSTIWTQIFHHTSRQSIFCVSLFLFFLFFQPHIYRKYKIIIPYFILFFEKIQKKFWQAYISDYFISVNITLIKSSLNISWEIESDQYCNYQIKRFSFSQKNFLLSKCTFYIYFYFLTYSLWIYKAMQIQIHGWEIYLNLLSKNFNSLI